MGNVTAVLPQAEAPESPLLDTRTFNRASYDDKPRHLPKAHQAALDQFLAPIAERISVMTDEGLWDIIYAARAVSQVNCGWQQYTMADLVYFQTVWELQARQQAG